MISTLEGILTESGPLHVVIEIQGIGYEVQVPLTTAESLPGAGERARLYIHPVYREDSATLYGFARKDDREFFQLLLDKVSGIGPRIALNILSRMSVAVLKQAIADGDIALISKCPGIGKKTAERLVIELRDKIFPNGVSTYEGGAVASTGDTETSTVVQDAISALVALGYRLPDADKAVRKVMPAPDAEISTEALIKRALQ